MIDPDRKNRTPVTKEVAEATRYLFDDLFGDDAEAIALELMQLPLGVATTPVGKLIEDMAQAERDVYGFECQQRANELAADERLGDDSSSQPSAEPASPLTEVSAPAEVSGARIHLVRPSAQQPIESTRPSFQLLKLYCAPGDFQPSAAARHKPNGPKSEWRTSFSVVWLQDGVEWVLEGRKKDRSSEVVLSSPHGSTVTPTSIDWMVPKTGEIQRISLFARSENVFSVQLGLGFAVSRVESMDKLRQESADPGWTERMPVIRFGD